MISEEIRGAYEKYVDECKAGRRNTVTRIENVQGALLESKGRKVIETIQWREKDFEKVIEKCLRKEYVKKEEDITIDIIKKKVQDVTGIRIITTYQDDIYEIVDILHHIPGINIDDEIDYVKNSKDNGYASYHIIAKVEIYSYLTKGTKLVTVEIQIRDLSMDYWAAVEHDLKYKKENPVPGTEETLKEIADILAAARAKVQELRKKNDKNPAG